MTRDSRRRDISNDDIIESLKRTHMHVLGSSGYGKSKFLEWLMRRLTLQDERTGFCVIDWHGTLYDELLKFFASIHYTEPIYLLDPSHSEYVTGFNPFSATATDMSAAVSRRIDATVKPWGAATTDETPLLSRMLRMLYSFAAEASETLPNAYLMFHGKNRNIRQYAATQAKDDYIRQQLADFATLTDSEVRRDTSSSMNRLDRFLAPTAIRRMIGRQSGNLNIRQILEENGVLLVNLAASEHLTNESGRLIAALLLNEFREAALARAGTDKHYFLFLDEFQEYVTHDIAAMLDQVRKGGLNLVLSHQHLGQLGDDDTLISSIATNARIKAVFGGLDYESATMVANEIRLKTVNRRQVEREIYGSAVLGHYVKTYINHSQSRSSSESTGETDTWSEQATKGEGGGFDEDEDPTITNWGDSTTESRSSAYSRNYGSSESSSEAESRLLLPMDGKELKSEQATSHEEKLSREAFDIMSLRPRELYLKLPQWKQANWRRVPFVEERAPYDSTIAAYRREIYEKTGAKPPDEIDQLMAESRDAFFVKALNYAATLKPKKKEGDDTPAGEGKSKTPPRPRST